MKPLSLAMTLVACGCVLFHARPSDRRGALNLINECHGRELTEHDVEEIEWAMIQIVPWRHPERVEHSFFHSPERAFRVWRLSGRDSALTMVVELQATFKGGSNVRVTVMNQEAEVLMESRHNTGIARWVSDVRLDLEADPNSPLIVVESSVLELDGTSSVVDRQFLGRIPRTTIR